MSNRLPTILSALALLVSLTMGGAYAAQSAGIIIPGTQIQRASIPVDRLTPKAIRTLKGQRGARGFRGNDGADGANGLPGAAGVAGAAGPAGGFNPAKVSYVTGPVSTIFPGQTIVIQAICPPGSKVTGGGYFSSINNVGATEPDVAGGASWSVIVQNNTSINVDSWAYAVCAAP